MKKTSNKTPKTVIASGALKDYLWFAGGFSLNSRHFSPKVVCESTPDHHGGLKVDLMLSEIQQFTYAYYDGWAIWVKEVIESTKITTKTTLIQVFDCARPLIDNKVIFP